MALNQTKTIQLLRSSSLYVPSGEGATAKTALENAKAALTALTGRKDGEIVLARYQEAGGSIKSVLGIYHDTPDLPGTATAGWTFIQDVTESEGSAAALQAEIDQIESSVGLGTDGTYTSGYTDDPVVGTPTTLKATADNIITYIKNLDVAARANATTDGNVVVTVSQADGEIAETTAALTDVVMAGYAADSTKTGAIAATDTLEQAFNKVENAIGKNAVASADGSVTITQPTTGSSAGKTDLAVNVDGTTLVKNQSTGTISSALKVIKVIPSGTAGTDEVVDSNLATNVKEAYRLVYDGSTTAIGQQINVYKDSALKEVYLGASTDTIDATTGTITKNTVTDPQSMNFAYQLADGTYSLVKIDVSKFLTESEFGDGLTVSGGVVSVEIDSASGKVRTAATPSGVTPGSADDSGLVDVLSVSSAGVKVDNIQAAIDYAVQNSSTSLAISAEGDNYITAAVDANNNKKINVTADVQPLTATAGTAGTYDADGAQTTAPSHGTLSGVADSLGDAADIATKVKTYVDGEIAIEAARSDAKNLADLKTVVEGLDGTATASSATNLDTAPTADFKVLTKVAEVDGKVVETTVANGSTAVTLKKLAATGAAADVSIADAGGLITETTVEGALQEIATNVRNNALVSNDVIVVTPDTTNNNTKLSVTTGNGLEKTGNNSDTLSVKAGDGIEVTSSGVGVLAGDGLVINSNTKAVDVNPGDGIKISSDAVAIKIDSTSAMADSTHGMLTVSANGLKLNDTWDCGTF